MNIKMIKEKFRRFFVRLLQRMPVGLKSFLVNQPIFKTQLRHYVDDETELICSGFTSLMGDIRLRIKKKYRIERLIIEYGAYDLDTMRFFDRVIKQGDVCFDIGANMGCMSFAMAEACGKSGVVHAFEPGPELQERLRYNIGLNSGLESIIQVHAIALSDENSKAYWKMDEGENYGNAMLSDEGVTAVVVNTLDCFVADRKIERLDFIKIDTEGMEYKVIKGGLASIQKHRPIIYFETLYSLFPDEVRKSTQQLLELDYLFYGFMATPFKLDPLHPEKFPQNVAAIPREKMTRLVN
jgi:FkbM family methyltransferase